MRPFYIIIDQTINFINIAFKIKVDTVFKINIKTS